MSEEQFNNARIIFTMEDGTYWETCTPLAKMPNGRFQSILAFRWSAGGEQLMSILIADVDGVKEHRATEALALYWPSYTRLADNKETAH